MRTKTGIVRFVAPLLASLLIAVALTPLCTVMTCDMTETHFMPSGICEAPSAPNESAVPAVSSLIVDQPAVLAFAGNRTPEVSVPSAVSSERLLRPPQDLLLTTRLLI